MRLRTFYSCLLVGFVCLSTMLGLTGCGEQQAEARIQTMQRVTPDQELLGGTHKLRKFGDASRSYTKQSGGWWFLLIAGGSSKKIEEIHEQKVRFAWQMNDGTYAVSEMDLSQIRVRIDSTITVPTIEFGLRHTADYWNNAPELSKEYYRTWDPQSIISTLAYCAVITVREEDWPISVKAPMN